VGGALVALGAYFIHPLALPVAALASAFVVLAFVRPGLGVAGALLAMPLDAFRLQIPLGEISPAEAAIAVVGLSWLIRYFLRPESVVRPAVRDIPVGILLLAVTMGVISAQDPVPVLRVLVFWTLSYFIYLQAQSLDEKEIRTALSAFALGAGVLGAIGAAQYLQTGDPQVFAGGSITSERAVGAFDDPNYYASLLSLALLPGLALLIYDFRRSAWLIVPVGAALAGLAFSLSRGAISGFAVGLLLLLAWRRARRVVLVAIAVVAILTLAGANPLVGSEYFGSVEERLSSIRNPTRESRRPEIWSAALDMTAQAPVFGVGVNQFQVEAASRTLYERNVPIENAHNIFLSLAAETGLVGVGAFLAFLAGLGRSALSFGGRAGLSGTLTLSLSAAFVAFLVQGLTVAQVRVSVLVAVLFLYAGMITGLADRRRRADLHNGEQAQSTPDSSSFRSSFSLRRGGGDL